MVVHDKNDSFQRYVFSLFLFYWLAMILWLYLILHEIDGMRWNLEKGVQVPFSKIRSEAEEMG